MVDDSISEAFKSARALCGWPNLHIDVFIYKSGDQGKSVEVERASAEILQLSPVIVVMDKDMYPIKGADVIRTLRESDEGKKYIFVANTGGDPSELHALRCFDNCNKGKNLEGIRRALRFLSSRE